MKKIWFVLIGVFVFTLLIRSFHLGELFPFTMDEEYQAFLVRRILQDGHIPLIGVSVAGTGLYLGPFFTYFSVIPFYLAQFDPMGSAWVSVILGSMVASLLSFFLYQLLVEEQNSQSRLFWAGLVGLLYAVNPLIRIYDLKYWNPSLVPLLSVLWLMAMVKIKSDGRWLVMLSLVFGLTLHTHYSLWALLPVSLVYCLYLWRKIFFCLSRKYLSLSLIIFSICLAPLVLFEIRHDFVMAKGFSQKVLNRTDQDPQGGFLNSGKTMLRTLDQLAYFGFHKDLEKEIVFCQASPFYAQMPFVGLLFLAILLIGSLYFQHLVYRFTFGVFLVSLSLGFFYKDKISQYYFLPLLSLLVICSTLFFYQVSLKLSGWYKYVFIGSLLGVTLFWGFQTVSLQNSLGLEGKRSLFKTMFSQLNGKPYELQSESTCFRHEGYRYLSEIWDYQPVRSYIDSEFGWLYGEVDSRNVEKVVTIIYEGELKVEVEGK